MRPCVKQILEDTFPNGWTRIPIDVNYSAVTDGASGRGLFPHPEDPHGDSCFSEG